MMLMILKTRLSFLRSLLFALALLPISVQAIEDRATHSQSTRLAISLMNFSYKEVTDKGDFLDREDGLLPGITISSVRPVYRLLMTGELSIYANDIKYDGQTQPPSSVPVESRTDTYIYDFSLSITHLLEGKNLIPERIYYGMGYRHWDRDIRNGETSSGSKVLGIHEVYRLPYILLGSRWDVVKSSQFNLSLDLRLNRTVSAEMYLDLYEGTTFDLGERFNGRISLIFASHASKGKNYYVEPFYEFWQIGKSDVENNSVLGPVYEPKSTTNNLGLNVGIQW